MPKLQMSKRGKVLKIEKDYSTPLSYNFRIASFLHNFPLTKISKNVTMCIGETNEKTKEKHKKCNE